jgi:stage III sporulation protein AE
MKRKILLGWLMLLIFLFPGSAGAVEEVDIKGNYQWQDIMEDLDIDALQNYKNQIDNEITGSTTGKSTRQWLTDFVKGDWNFDFKKVWLGLKGMFFKKIQTNISLLVKLIILSVISALLINLQSSFSSDIARFSYLSCFMALSAIALGSFKLTLGIGQQAIDNMVGFMTAMLPQMMVLVAGLGNVNSSIMLFPVLMSTVTAFANAIKNVVLPLIILSAVLSIINQISVRIRVEKMAKFIKQLAQISLGFFMTLFVGVITIKTIYTSVLDKVVLRTGKFVTDNAIPVVGKILSDTIEVTAGYVMILKSAVSIYGVLVIIGLIITPLIEIAVMALIYKLVGAIIEPLGDNGLATVMEDMSGHLALLLAAIASVSIMFLIMIALIAGLTNNFTLPG